MGKLVTGIISTVLWIIVATVMWYNFKSNCDDYLKLAGDAPSIEKADKFLGRALNYMESNDYTSGNSAIIFKTPDCDIGIWYEQIKGAKATTEAILQRIEMGENVTQLEKDNALMKIREVLLDNSSDGTKVTTPDWISMYPLQLVMALWLLGTIALFIWFWLTD